MNMKRIAAIIAIYLLACLGWGILGTATQVRSVNFGRELGNKVQGLYGSELVQQAPSFGVQIPGSDQLRWLMPVTNNVSVDIAADYRKKGLLWYSTFTCAFDASYTLANQEEVAQKVRVHFDFPAKEGTYDNFTLTLDGQPLGVPIDTRNGVDEIVELTAGQSVTLRVRYETLGLGQWRYRLDSHAGRVQGFTLKARTNFENFDYPESTRSATVVDLSDDGATLTWKTTDLITQEDFGVLIPERLNPGPLTTRITFFAPVCLLFFFVLVMAINILYKVPIHPMHYLFVAAGFFAFHLLLSYLAGLVNIHVSFAIAAVVSVALVTCYLSASLKGAFPWKVAVAGQVFFLILFSYSFFLKGVTGLTVAIGSVLTLALLMWATAQLDWNEVFASPQETQIPPKLPEIKA